MTIKTKSRRSRRTEKKKNNIGLWLVGILGLVVVLMLAAVGFSNSRSTSAANITPPDVPAEWVNGKSLGDPEAVVVIEAWEDFLCPACGDWNRLVKPVIFEKYVQTGKARLEFNHFPLSMHAPGAQMAAMASECAVDQGAFWPYHDRLFQVQSQGQGAYTLDSLAQHADEMGLDRDAFFQCMSSQQHRSTVDESYNRAVAQGLNATPSILINGVRMQAPDANGISAEIDRLLAAAGAND